MKPVQGTKTILVHDDLYVVILVRFWMRRETPEGFVDVKYLTWREFGSANTGWTVEQGPLWLTDSGFDKATQQDELRKRLADLRRNSEILPDMVINDCISLYLGVAGDFTIKLREETARNT